MSKSNIDHLRTLCAEMPDEVLEFIDGVEAELVGAKADLNYANKKISKLETQVEELENQIEEEMPNTIDAGIGKIYWQSDNLQLRLVMENVKEKLGILGPVALLQ